MRKGGNEKLNENIKFRENGKKKKKRKIRKRNKKLEEEDDEARN